MNDLLTRAIPDETVKEAISALEVGLENTQELLSDHDIRLGRTTRRNRLTAERLEAEIQQIRSTIDKLQS